MWSGGQIYSITSWFTLEGEGNVQAEAGWSVAPLEKC